MRFSLFLFLVLMVAFAAISEESRKPVFRYAGIDSVPVFPKEGHRQGETPLFFLKKGERVQVSGLSGESDSITLADGRTGWVEKRKLIDNSRQSFMLDELKVFGFLDNPDPVYILDYDNGEYKPIRVARDFIFDPDLMKNIEKESFEWENEIYYYKGYKFSPEAVKPPEILKSTE